MDTTTLPRNAASGTLDAPAAFHDRTSLDDLGKATTTRFQRLWRGPEQDPSWARPALLGLLAATALLYVYNLTASGYANSFYSAAVQAGSVSWKAFLFGSSDAGNSITVDKPPAALWIMALSVRAFGLSSFSILLPEVLMGVATVGVVYTAVKRHFGAAAGLLAGVTLALTPVAVLMFRFNNPDALLVLLMALGAWATMKSIEQGSARWFAIVGVFIGLGFLTKALQVFLVVPAFGLAYLLFADTTLRRRITGALVGVASMVLSAGWWVAIVQLVPASMRPYIGGSQDNSFLSVTFGYNGLGRISGNETGSVGGGNGWGTPGLLRMFSSSVGGQISWLIPAAMILLVVGLALRGRAPRTDLRRAAYVVWGGWLVVTMLTFSLMAGIFHEYYTVALAPAIAAVVGMGAAEAWKHRGSRLGSGTLAVAVASTALWSFMLLSRTDWQNWLRIVVLALGLASALLLLAITHLERRWVPAVVAAALVSVLAGPAAYSMQTVSTGHTGSIVTAGPSTGRGGPGGGLGGQRGGFPGGMPGGAAAGTNGTPSQGLTGTAPQGATGTAPQGGTATAPQGMGGGRGLGGLLDASTPNTEVTSALAANASSYRWVAAAIGSQNAAGLQLGTGLPVMPIGGFNGSDPSPTLAQFEQYVAAGQIHYFVAGSGTGGGPGGGQSGTGSQISAWVAAHYTRVTIGGSTFYDLTKPLGTTSSTSSTTSQST